jgi:DNA repair protein RadD
VTYTLRGYQEKAVESLFSYFDSNNGNPLLILPTASGKGIIQAAFIQQALQRYPNERFLLVSHVRELLQQNYDKLIKLWPEAPAGLYSAGLGKRNIAQITVAGVQSIYKKADELGDVSVVVIDECHLVSRDSDGMYQRLLGGLREINPHLKVIGLSATPYRLDSGCLHEGKDRLFTDIAYEADIISLVRDGYLCSLFSRMGIVRTSLAGVHTRAGEYALDELEQVMDTSELVDAAVDEIAALCHDRKKILVFCVGVAHAKHVAERMNEVGIKTGCVIGSMQSDDRDAVLHDFRFGDTRAVTNCNVLSVGFDFAEIDAVVMLRPTKSTGLYVQMIGRGMRVHEGKKNTYILDFAGNILEHGPIDMVKVHSVKDRERAMFKECPMCHGAIPAGYRFCTQCGYVYPPVEVREPKHRDQAGDVAVLSIDNSVLSQSVNDVGYSRHKKEGKPDSLLVEYLCGRKVYREWVCIEHEGYAGEKAQWWLNRRFHEPIATVTEALEYCLSFKRPKKIVVDTSSKYARVVSCSDFEDLEEGDV